MLHQLTDEHSNALKRFGKCFISVQRCLPLLCFVVLVEGLIASRGISTINNAPLENNNELRGTRLKRFLLNGLAMSGKDENPPSSPILINLRVDISFISPSSLYGV